MVGEEAIVFDVEFLRGVGTKDFLDHRSRGHDCDSVVVSKVAQLEIFWIGSFARFADKGFQMISLVLAAVLFRRSWFLGLKNVSPCFKVE